MITSLQSARLRPGPGADCRNAGLLMAAAQYCVVYSLVSTLCSKVYLQVRRRERRVLLTHTLPEGFFSIARI